MSDYKKIILKNSPVPNAVPLEDFLDYGEVALNYADKKLYYRELGGAVTVHETPDIDVEGAPNSIVRRNLDGSGLFNGVISETTDPDLYAIRATHSAGVAARIVGGGNYTAAEIVAVSGIGANISSTSGIGANISSTSGTGAIISSTGGSAAIISSGASTYHAEFGNVSTNNSAAIERVRGSYVWFYNGFKGKLRAGDITADCSWTLPNRSGMLGITTDTLAQFSSTTSAQLAGVISDETGTGSLVFNGSPTLSTPTISTINGSTAASGTLTLRSTSSATKNTAGIRMTDGIASSSSTTGTLVVTGGVGVSGDIYAAGGVYSNNEILATKSYVDSIAEGLHVHAQAHVILNTPLETITGGAVTYNNGVDGVGAYLTLANAINFSTGLDGDTDLEVGSRIIVNGQGTPAHNGIYTISSTTQLTRASDFDTPTEMGGGDFIFVTHGDSYANTGWVLGEPVTSVGVSPVNFIQFSGAGTPVAGAGLTADGLILNVGGTSGRIIVGADAIDLASTGVTPNTYKSVTVDTYGRVTTGSNPTTLTGYGITDALSASSTSTQDGYFGNIFLYDDSSPSHYLGFTNSANLTANRTLSVNVNDADRTLSLNGNLTVSADSTLSGTNTGDQTTITGNAGSATVLQTARNINGTSFNGSTDITTATWGSSRTLTIGSTGKSVDGSVGVSWSLAEIGAQPLDADLTAIAGLSGTSGLLRKTAPDSWTLDTTTYSVSGHTHTIADTTGLQDALDSKQNAVATFDSTITGSGKTFSNTDNGKIFHITGTNTCVLPQYSAIDDGWSIGIVNVGGNTLTFNVAGGSSNTINDNLLTFTNTVKYSALYIYKSDIANKFFAIGILY